MNYVGNQEEDEETTVNFEFLLYYSRYTLCFAAVHINWFMVFSFLPKNVHFISKNAILCLFLKNISPSKRVVCFILNNLHLPMVEGIAFYALHKLRVLIIPCKADGFCLFIGLPDEVYKCRLISLSNLEFNFFIVLCSNLKKTFHY